MDVTSPLLPAGYDVLEPFDDSCMLQQGPAGLRVLLCEGQQHNTDTSALLSSCGFSTTVAADVQHALNFLQDPSSHFDVILADTSVLGHSLSGASAQALFNAAASSGTPVVLTAEHHSTSQVMEAVHAGAADVLDRPLSYSKLQNLWQHAVRASLTSSKSDTTKDGAFCMHQHAHHMQQQQQCSTPTLVQVSQQQQHPAFPAAPRERPSNAAAGVSSRVLSPICLGLLDDCSPIDGLQCLDGLGGLELPPLVPSQLDLERLDSILTDMQAAEHSAAPSAVAAGALGPLMRSASPSNSNALTAVAASLFGSSSEQQCSGNRELESSCADATSGSPQSRRRKLHACTSLRSMAAAGAAARTADLAAGGFGNATLWPTFGCHSMMPTQPSAGNTMGPPMNPIPGVAGTAACTAVGSSQWGGVSHNHMNMSMPMNMAMNVPAMNMAGQLPRGWSGGCRSGLWRWL